MAEDKTTDNKKEFHKKMLAVQKALADKAIKPEGKNPHFNSDFVTLGQWLKLVKPILLEQELLLVQTVGQIDGQPVLTTSITDGNASYADTMLLLSKASDPQAQGSAITYARRYSLMAMLGLWGDEDDDGNASSPVSTGRSTTAENGSGSGPADDGSPMSEAQAKLVMSTMKRKGVKTDDEAKQVFSAMAKTPWDELTRRQTSKLIDDMFKLTREDIAEYLGEAEDEGEEDGGDS